MLAASALAKRQTQFVQVRYAARHNQRRQTALPLPLAIVLRAVDAVQTAVLATLATLPVLLLHGMAASGAAVPANLLVVWLLGPALRLGILALVLSFVPVLDPLFHGASLLLGIVLRLMTTLAAWCAALPVAHIALPVRYTLWVLAVFAVLAALFWRTRQLRRFVPVGFVCAVAAVMLGSTMQRDVVRLAMVGTAGNGCVVAVQNNRAVVLYRGSAANGRAVQQYLTQNGAPELAAVIDLRTEPGEMPLQTAQLLTIADLPQGLTHLQLLDTVEVDLLHTNAAALAVLDVGGWHAAASAGKLILADPVAVDLYCAGGSCPEAIQAKAILCNQQTPKWLSKVGIPLFITMPKPRLPWCAPAKVLCMRRCSPLLYSETELKKRLKSGCPVFYFYASDEALVRSAAAKAEKFLSEEVPDTTTLDGPTPVWRILCWRRAPSRSLAAAGWLCCRSFVRLPIRIKICRSSAIPFPIPRTPSLC